MIEIQNVSFEYEKSQGTLSHIDLNIQQGECIVLTGESGCGKTTITYFFRTLQCAGQNQKGLFQDQSAGTASISGCVRAVGTYRGTSIFLQGSGRKN